MANSKLQGQSFDIDKKIKDHLNLIFNAYKGAKNEEGYQRLEKLVGKDSISYEQLKLIKNFFDSYNGSKKSTPYLLNGGTIMKNWVQETLDDARGNSNNTEKSMNDIGMSAKSDFNPKINKIDTEKHDSDTKKILRNEGIYNMRLMEDLITIIDKNKKLCLHN